MSNRPPSLLTRSDSVLHGAVVFAGTRVPLRTLMEYLEEGSTLDAFLDDFPSVTREHAIAVLEMARDAAAGRAHPAG